MRRDRSPKLAAWSHQTSVALRRADSIRHPRGERSRRRVLADSLLSGSPTRPAPAAMPGSRLLTRALLVPEDRDTTKCRRPCQAADRGARGPRVRHRWRVVPALLPQAPTTRSHLASETLPAQVLGGTFRLRPGVP